MSYIFIYTYNAHTHCWIVESLWGYEIRKHFSVQPETTKEIMCVEHVLAASSTAQCSSIVQRETQWPWLSIEQNTTRDDTNHQYLLNPASPPHAIPIPPTLSHRCYYTTIPMPIPADHLLSYHDSILALPPVCFSIAFVLAQFCVQLPCVCAFRILFVSV